MATKPKGKRVQAPRTVPEEAVFEKYDRIADRLAGRLGRYIERLFRRASQSLDEQTLSAAQSLQAPSLVNQAANWIALDADFQQHLAPPIKEPEPEQKARRGAPKSDPFQGIDPSGIVQEAVDAGIRLGIETLPTREAREAGIDFNAARRRAYASLNRDLIKQSLQALRESREALMMLVDHPKHLMGDTGDDVRSVLDGRMLRQLFGLDKRQATALVREVAAMAQSGKVTRAEMRQYVMRRYRAMLKTRIDMLAKTITYEAVNKGQRAAWEQAKLEGVIKDEWRREWVARVLPCPRCLAFDGKRVELWKPFRSDLGEVLNEPPAHPNCRCRCRLVKPRTEAGQSERSRRLRRSA